jgi:hypothetical protein
VAFGTSPPVYPTRRLDHAGHLSDQILHAPEAAACQKRPFRLHCHVTTSQLKALADE